MNRTELIRQVAGETGLGAAEAAVKAVLASVAGALARDGAARGVRDLRGEAAPGAHGAQSPDRRADRRAGLAGGVVPPGQGAPRRGERVRRVAGPRPRSTASGSGSRRNGSRQEGRGSVVMCDRNRTGTREDDAGEPG